MKLTDVALIVMFIIVHIELILYKHSDIFKRFKRNKKEVIIKSLSTKQREDELVLEKDKDLTSLDEYTKYIKTIIDDYNKSRSKRISLKTRKEALLETFKIVPIASKYITLNYYYNLEDKEFNLNDKELMTMLETAYNDYNHDNLDSLNSIFTVVLRLRDEKK